MADHLHEPLGKKLIWVWRGLTLLWIVLLVNAVVSIGRGVPGSYHNEHSRQIAGAVSGLLLAGAFQVRRPRLRWVLTASAFIAVVVSFALAS
jgi:hypothetical protein